MYWTVRAVSQSIMFYMMDLIWSPMNIIFLWYSFKNQVEWLRHRDSSACGVNNIPRDEPYHHRVGGMDFMFDHCRVQKQTSKFALCTWLCSSKSLWCRTPLGELDCIGTVFPHLLTSLLSPPFSCIQNVWLIIHCNLLGLKKVFREKD